METSSRAGLGLVKTFEGCKLAAYLCPAGVPTIGYGRTRGVKLDQKITQVQADTWVEQEYDEFEAGVLALVDKGVRARLTPNMVGALTALAYNIGLPSFKTSTVLRMVNASNFPAAAAAFSMWNKITQDGQKVVSRGLARRRDAEASLFLK